MHYHQFNLCFINDYRKSCVGFERETWTYWSVRSTN